MMKKYLYFSLVTVVLLNSCGFSPQEALINQTKSAVWAVPLINDEVKLQDLFTVANTGDVEIETDEEGKVTVVYQGEVLNDPASVVFPPIFGIFDIPFSDSIFQLDLSQAGTTQDIDSAVFLRDELYFKYNYSGEDPLVITLTVDELKKDGQPLTQIISHPGSSDGSVVQVEAPPVKINGYTMAGNDNLITFRYDARKLNGDRIEIDLITFNWNLLEFAYVEGSFPKSEREIIGSFIPIGLYNRWLSGTMDFVEPSIEVNAENTFGFSVGAEFKEMTLETIDGEIFELTSSIIDDGILFNFPDFDEMGEVKYTNFNFTEENSNFKEIFNNRVKQFNYRINAIANPLDDPEFKGYLLNENYYAVQLRVEVPMHLGIQNLQVVDTFDFSFDLPEYNLDSLQFKLILENKFPIDVTTQLYMLDEDNEVIDSLFEEGEIFLPGGTYSGSSTLTNISSASFFIDMTEERVQKFMDTKRILVRPTFRSTPNGSDPIWIYDTYGLGVKLGAKFSLE